MANRSFVVQYIIKMRGQFAAEAAKFKQAMKGIGTQIDETKKKFKKFTEATKKAGTKMSAFITAPIALAAFSLKNAARDAGETESKFGTVFKSISGKANKAAKDLAKNYGLSRTESKMLLSDTGDLLSGFGFTQEKSLELSSSVNKLAVDLASFTNYSGGAKGASAALTKALLGERESLKSLGIAISEENVKKKIMAMMAQGVQFQTLRQAKAQATLALAMEQSKNAIGDFSRTQEDLANQERITNSRIQNMKDSFGKLLLPISLKITKAIGKMAVWLEKLSPATKTVVLGFGAFLATIGPVLLGLASLGAIIPFIKAGFLSLRIAAATAFGPIGLIIIALIIAAALIISNWDTVKSWFASFWKFIVGVFDGIKEKVMGFITTIIDAHKKIFEFFGIDFGKAEVETRNKRITEATISNKSKVDVGVRVGLDKGLRQTSEPVVINMGARRADVGMVGG